MFPDRARGANGDSPRRARELAHSERLLPLYGVLKRYAIYERHFPLGNRRIPESRKLISHR
jgi:hypothetical protein